MTMINEKRFQSLVLLLMILLTVGSVFEVSAQRRRRPVRRRVTHRTAPVATTPVPTTTYFTVPANTVIRVRMDTELNSRTARLGDRFSTTVTEPVYGGGSGTDVIPVGSKIWGRVSSVTRAGRRTPGNIAVDFNSVELPNGHSYVINGSLTSLQADNVNADNEGTVRGRSNTKRDAVFIGGGAATGAIIGAIAGGGKGAAIGTILGGALGTGARVYEKEQEAEVKSGTQFGVILNRAVSIAVTKPV
ncbi:MAG TPA: TrbI/VirB10 family protein [Pyrinomonadaceae bacterium]|nr:TrbI/VirB10 family protein [Pyrinomonadaceae bacterium]